MFDQRFDKKNNFLSNESWRLMWNRMYGAEYENAAMKENEIPCIDHTKFRLNAAGGFPQQDRMIRDKRRTLDRAVLYSYQGALIKKIQTNTGEMVAEEEQPKFPVRALINPNKLKQDYDDKIVSVGFEFDFKAGDVFEWVNTDTYWLIYLQELSELAYFRGNIRRCSYTIDWIDEDGNKQTTYAAVRGPVETKIEYLQKHGISIDRPNYSLNLLMPKNEKTMQAFQRYSKFYLQGTDDPDRKICWRVEATDSISTPNILEIVAVEYYANETEDDVEEGLVGVNITKIENPNTAEDKKIASLVGETFIKPKVPYIYHMSMNVPGTWKLPENVPLKSKELTTEDGLPAIKIMWDTAHTGQFDISYGKHKKTIIVESLFE